MSILRNNFFILLANVSVGGVIGSTFFLIIGSIFFHIGLHSLCYILKSDKVDAVITNMVGNRNSNHSPDVYVSYEYNGHVYPNTRLHTYNSSFYIGKAITLYTSPKSPNKPEHSSSILFIPIGLVALAFALLLFCDMF